MANAQTIKFSEFVFQFGDGGNPEQFSKPCGVTSRDFSIEPNLSSTAVPSCDDDDAASWLEQDTVSMQASGTIAGTVDDHDYDSLLDWALSGASRNAKLIIKARLLTGAFKAALTSTGEKGKRVTFSVKLTLDGALTRVT